MTNHESPSQANPIPLRSTGTCVQPCGQPVARWAVENWHYTEALPAVITAGFTCFEDGRYVGVVVFGGGAAPNIGRPFGVGPRQCCELIRVAFRDHTEPISHFVAEAIRQLRADRPGLRIIVSYADTNQDHHGGIYQAGNWIYLGPSIASHYRINGRLVHGRTLGSRFGRGGQSIPWLREHVDPDAERVKMPPKHKYVYPLDRQMRRRVQRKARPYPRAGSVEGNTPANQTGDGGSTPSPAL
jgi:hypothetical protein